MGTRTVNVFGRTITQFAQHVGVHPKVVRGWIDAGRLDVVVYTNGLVNGTAKHSLTLLTLILDDGRPAPLTPVRR